MIYIINPHNFLLGVRTVTPPHRSSQWIQVPVQCKTATLIHWLGYITITPWTNPASILCILRCRCKPSRVDGEGTVSWGGYGSYHSYGSLPLLGPSVFWMDGFDSRRPRRRWPLSGGPQLGSLGCLDRSFTTTLNCSRCQVWSCCDPFWHSWE